MRRYTSPCSECPTIFAKTGSPVERMNITFVPGGHMVVLPGSISAKVSKMSCHEYKGYKWQCPTTQPPTQQHSDAQTKIIWVDQVTPPPPGKDKGWGSTWGGGYQKAPRNYCQRTPQFSPKSPPMLPKNQNKSHQHEEPHRSVGVHIPNLRGSASPTRGATPKRGSPYPQLEGPHQSVGVHVPNLRGHTTLWIHESLSPT